MNDKEMQWSFVAPQREDMPAIQAYKEEFESHHQLLHGTSDSTELETAMAAVPNRTFLLKDGEGEIVGMGNIRLGLNLYLYEQAGHIGYSRAMERSCFPSFCPWLPLPGWKRC